MGILVLPQAAYADCVQQMSRIPIAAPAGGGPTYRANMLRTRPAVAPARPRAMKAKASGASVRKARPVRKASLHRPARKATPAIRRVATPPQTYPRPTPMPVAARDLATPRAFALIATTVCEATPGAAAAPDAGVPVLAIEPGVPDDGFIPGSDTETVLPPVIGPDFPDIGGPGSGGGVFLPPSPPPIEPPVIGPPIVTPVPEPGTWALLILGFGLIGARLRATSSAVSGSRGRAGRPE